VLRVSSRQMGLQSVASTHTSIDARTLAGITTLLIAALLSLLYFYRRRVYILCWVSGWVLTAMSLLLAAHHFEYPPPNRAAFGVSQFLAIVGALVFVLGGDAYRTRLHLRRGYLLILLPLLIWFALAPVALETWAVLGPGYLLIAGALAAAGIAHLALLREARLLGAAIVGLAFLSIAGANVWLVLSAPLVVNDAAQAEHTARDVSRMVFITLALDLVAALGMQLMTFEDMTYELRVANRRLESAQGELRHLVTTDSLTGCRNRRFFDDVIGREIQRHRRYGIPLSLMFVDVDRFKAINDTLGHEAGDRVLQQVAAFLIRNVREADYVFRWGGDEFLVLMSCRESEAVRKGTDLQASFADSEDARDLPPGVGLSVGCAELTADAEDIMAVVKVADERMYVNKKRA
jgi:two-component system cell cycle response regulator